MMHRPSIRPSCCRPARDDSGIFSATSDHTTERPAGPQDVTEAGDRFEHGIAGLTELMAACDVIAQARKPPSPHDQIGVIGTRPARHRSGVGTQLLRAFSQRSAADRGSSGVSLETANPSKVRFGDRAGSVTPGQERLASATPWCMFPEPGPG